MKLVVPSFCGMKNPSQKEKKQNIYIIIRENRRYMLDCHDQSTIWQNIGKKKLFITFCCSISNCFSQYVKGFEAQFLYKDILSSTQGLIF